MIRHTALFATLLALTAWVHLPQFSAGLQWDSIVYLLIGKWWHQGLIPYADLWSVKPPGLFAYIAGVFTILPVALWSLRFTDWLLFSFGAWAFYALCRSIGVGILVAFLATALWAVLIHHPFYDLGGLYTEEYVMVFSAFALLAAIRGRSLLAGAAVVCTAAFKQPGAAVIIPALILLPRRSLLRFCAGMALVVGLAAIYFAAHGALSALCRSITLQAIEFPRHTPPFNRNLLQYGNAMVRAYGFWPPVVVFSLGLAALLRCTRLLLAAWLWLLASFTAIWFQGPLQYPHYWILTFGPFVLLVVSSLQATLPSPRLQTLIVTLVVVVSFPNLRTFIHQRNVAVRPQLASLVTGNWRVGPGLKEDAAVGDYLRSHTDPSDRVYVALWKRTALSQYWYADRLPASSRLCTAGVHLFGFTKQVGEDLTNHARLVVTQGGDWFGWCQKNGWQIVEKFPGPYQVWARRQTSQQ
jgi:hypothetical protein